MKAIFIGLLAITSSQLLANERQMESNVAVGVLSSNSHWTQNDSIASTLSVAGSLQMGSDWLLHGGLGAGAMQTQKPSNTADSDDKIEFFPIPSLGIAWRNRLSLSTEGGLAVQAGSEEHGQYSASLYLDSGRDANELNSQWQGLGSLKPAATLNLSANYTLLSIVQMDGMLTHILDYNGSAKGQTANLNLTTGLPLGEQLIMFVQGGAQLASQDYLQSYYGISNEQANKHGLTAFEPEAGIYQYNNALGLMFEPGNQWSAMLGVNNSWLVGDAGKSPLLERKRTITGMGSVTYAF